jgi:tetratricopeptide (TPR) repeat protein
MIDLTSVHELRQAGRHEEACELVRLVAQYPHDPIIQYETACVHDFLGRESEAIPFYLAAIGNGLSGEQLRGAYLGLGSTYRALGQYAESKLTLDEGLARFPNAAELRVFLAMTLSNLGQGREAVSLLLRVVAEGVSDPGVRKYERAIQFYAGDLDRVWLDTPS